MLYTQAINSPPEGRHALFHQMRDTTDINPCQLKRGELPKKADKDPTWRAGAVFTRGEVELLISSPDLPEEVVSRVVGKSEMAHSPDRQQPAA